MTKPNEYRETYLVLMDMPYRNIDIPHKGSHSSEGVLHKGRVVWLREKLCSTDGDAQVSAYAEGVGLVLVPSHKLEHLSPMKMHILCVGSHRDLLALYSDVLAAAGFESASIMGEELFMEMDYAQFDAVVMEPELGSSVASFMEQHLPPHTKLLRLDPAMHGAELVCAVRRLLATNAAAAANGSRRHVA